MFEYEVRNFSKFERNYGIIKKQLMKILFYEI